MSQWDQTPAESNFIIPDEDVPSPAAASSNPYSASAGGPSGGQSSFWTPKVDLSLAFTPFIKSKDFQETNTIRERQYAGGDTLDEPVWHTLRRDLAQIGKRLAIVVWPAQLKSMARAQQDRLVSLASDSGFRIPEQVINAVRPVVDDSEEAIGGGNSSDVAALDWDLWGPLIFLLVYSVTMGFAAPGAQTNVVFSGTFTFIWVFYFIVGLNIQLLGGTISFFSAISATGYSMFPLVVGSVICTLFVKWRLLSLIILGVLFVWSDYAAIMSLRCLGVLPGRVLLALYPVSLMYAILAWLAIIT